MAFLSNILFHYNLQDNTNNNAIVVCVQNEDFKSPRFNVHKMVCLIRLRPTVGGNKTSLTTRCSVVIHCLRNYPPLFVFWMQMTVLKSTITLLSFSLEQQKIVAIPAIKSFRTLVLFKPFGRCFALVVSRYSKRKQLLNKLATSLLLLERNQWMREFAKVTRERHTYFIFRNWINDFNIFNLFWCNE